MNPIREALPNVPGHWGKGTFHNPADDTFCGLGHVREQTKNSKEWPENWHRSLVVMSQIAVEQYPERAHDEYGNGNFVSFNDHEDTTEEDVISVMEKAAVRYDETTW